MIQKGLRPPQIGALHAVLAHWTVSTDPATVVMPTGTGKTETMLALLVAERIGRLLVIVPTDTLRDQISEKFLTLGVLQPAVVGGTAQLPIVGILSRRPKTADEADDFFRRCSVVVTTAQIAGGCTDEVRATMASLCTHLFVDEAHHVRAPTWERVRASFAGRPVVQFTATPYRGDGKLVDGKVVYNYPLRKAQEAGYFRTITFRAIEEFNDELSDERIARVAVEQLDADIEAGFDHLLLARCSSIARAESVYAVYRRLAEAHHPLLVHSKLPLSEKVTAIMRLRDRRSRIVVCVDMFGEGFDLPELKVAAVHDAHKSLAVTLQFTGRFTRVQPNVGSATVIANTADIQVDESLQSLYGEDPDWNILLREISDEATGAQHARSEFLRGFTGLPEHVPLQNIAPKMSTVVYQTRCRTWQPDATESVVKNLYDKPAVHSRERVLVFVTKEHNPVEWGDIRGICDTVYDLYLLHWDQSSQLLFVHSSNKATVHEALAKAVCGEGVQILRGQRVFRVLSGINRLVLMNLGLGHSLSRAVRFTMHVGPDIREGWTQAQAQNKYKTNLFGRGYADGDKATIGCSTKGRIWSYRVAHDISQWMDWCHDTGRKLLDDTVTEEEILSGVMIPETITERPFKVPIAAEWSEDLLQRSEDLVFFEVADVRVPLYEVDLALETHEEAGPIRLSVSSDEWSTPAVLIDVRFGEERVDYVPRGRDISIIVGSKRLPLGDYLQAEPPIIRFHDGSFLVYNELFPPPGGTRAPFDVDRIDPWDWTGVDLTKESQGRTKRPDSIQRRVIERLLAAAGDEQWDVVFDDDSSGEAADIIAIRSRPGHVTFRLLHCKYAHGPASARVRDLYEVCGQAQRSVFWKGQPAQLIDHLLRREARRQAQGGPSRFERGTAKILKRIKRQLQSVRPEVQIAIVQPGVSKAVIELAELDLLAATELYLQETYNVPLDVISSN